MPLNLGTLLHDGLAVPNFFVRLIVVFGLLAIERPCRPKRNPQCTYCVWSLIRPLLEFRR